MKNKWSLLGLSMLVSCSSTDERVRQEISPYSDSRVIAWIPEEKCKAVQGGFLFKPNQLQVLLDKNHALPAIQALPTFPTETEDLPQLFLFSCGIHVILSENSIPEFVVLTSSAPQIEVIRVRKLEDEYYFGVDSELVAAGTSEEYFKYIGPRIIDLIEDPIARNYLSNLGGTDKRK